MIYVLVLFAVPMIVVVAAALGNGSTGNGSIDDGSFC